MSAQSKSSAPPPPPSAELNALILAEFQYIASSTNQSSEDRARVSNYYLVTIGAAIAAIFSKELSSTALPAVSVAIGIGFVGLAVLGLFTLLTLIRLRVGWIEGAKAMDSIKEYYAKIYDHAQLDTAFEWERENLPLAGKPDSVAFWTAASTILVDSVMMGLGFIFIGAGLFTPSLDGPLLVAGIVGTALSAIGQLYIYWHQLPLHRPISRTATAPQATQSPAKA